MGSPTVTIDLSQTEFMDYAKQLVARASSLINAEERKLRFVDADKVPMFGDHFLAWGNITVPWKGKTFEIYTDPSKFFWWRPIGRVSVTLIDVRALSILPELRVALHRQRRGRTLDGITEEISGVLPPIDDLAPKVAAKISNLFLKSDWQPQPQRPATAAPDKAEAPTND